MDKNFITGLVLIFTVLLVYTYFPAPAPESTPANKQAKTEKKTQTALPASPQQSFIELPDTAKSIAFGTITTQVDSTNNKPQNVVIENTDLKITLSSYGGRIIKAELKNYKTWNAKPLLLIDSVNTREKLVIPFVTGKANLYNFPSRVKTEGKNKAIFSIVGNKGQLIEQSYSLPEKGFMLSYGIKTAGLESQLGTTPAVFSINQKAGRLEQDLAQNRNNCTVNYYSKEGEFDNLGESKQDEINQSSSLPLKWISLKQKFFNVGFIANNRFEGGNFHSVTKVADTNDIKTLDASVNIPVSDLNKGAGFTWYFGPNKYKTLVEVTDGYHKNVYLGYPIINLVNRFIVVNVFYFLESTISSYGIIIIILVLLLKTLLFPLTYRSYIGTAKMKVLKPELDELKASTGDDTQKFQQEQMKLYSQFGINPLAGCIPMLLQLPILFAMFNFFPNSIELRQQSFLWAHDLSTFDSVATLPFALPGYGSHVSLFTILMTASTLVLTYYNNQTTTVTGPMQSMSYIMPIFFMFMLNTLPAGLNFYYLVSNIVSIGQQVIIRNYVDESSIRRKLEENKVKNATKKKGKFAQRLEDALKSAEEMKKAEAQRKKK